MDRDAHLYTPKQISIHSLRMEGDNSRTLHNSAKRGISIHSLRMEGDLHAIVRVEAGNAFQSTPSVWRETSGRSADWLPRSISIHSLRMEGD